MSQRSDVPTIIQQGSQCHSTIAWPASMISVPVTHKARRKQNTRPMGCSSARFRSNSGKRYLYDSIRKIENFFFLAFPALFHLFPPFPHPLHLFFNFISYVLSAPAIYTTGSVTFGRWEKEVDVPFTDAATLRKTGHRFGLRKKR